MNKTKALLIVAVTTALAGCGESTTTVETGVTKRPSAPTAPAQPQTPSVGEEVPNEQHVGAVPNEIGLRLDFAEKDLNSKKLPYKVIGGSSGGVARGDWTVCEMNPAPRTHLEFGTTIRLLVAHSCRHS
jgi:PASTA domain-containing protein